MTIYDEPPATMLPPQNLEAEQSVLGACIIDADAVLKACDILEPSDFYRPAHGLIFAAVCELASRGEPVDLVTLSDELRRREALDSTGGVSYQATLADIVPTTANVEHYARIVLERSMARQMIEAASRIEERCFKTGENIAQMLDECEEMVLAVGERRVPSSHDGPAVMARVAEKLKAGYRGLRWEMESLNRFAGEMSDEEFTLVGGLTGVGKSLMGRDETRGKCKRGIGVLVFSLELSEEKFRERLLAAEMGLAVRALRAGAKHPQTSWVKDGTMDRTAAEIGRWPLVVDERGSLTVAQVAAKARRVKRDMQKHGTPLGLIVIDYAGLLDVRAASEYERSKRIAESIRVMVKSLRVPTLVVTQVTEEGGHRRPTGEGKENEKDHRGAFPRMKSRDAPTWEHGASIVIYLHWPARDYDPGSFEHEANKHKGLVLVKKNRDGGGQGLLKVAWDTSIGGYCDPATLPPAMDAAPTYDDEEPDFGDPLADVEVPYGE